MAKNVPRYEGPVLSWKGANLDLTCPECGEYAWSLRKLETGIWIVVCADCGTDAFLSDVLEFNSNEG